MQDFLQKILHDENRIYTPRRKKKKYKYLRVCTANYRGTFCKYIGSNNKGLLITIINCCSLFRCSLSLG